MNGEHESPRPESGIGRSLQEAREERGLTLRQVEEGTKVRARYLQDLERENFGVLPAVYVLGSLKTYADHLGLDGKALSADLKRRLEPDEPEDLPEKSAEAGSDRNTEDEYEAASLLTVGFDHLFLGMGLVLICSLAVMTLVFALATNDGPAVSQIREPAIPETPSEITLAGNFLERPEHQPRSQVALPEPESKESDGRNEGEKDGRTENEADSPKDDDKDRPEQQPEDASSQDSLFGDVTFVPAPSFSPPVIGTASPVASAGPLPTTPTSSASASPAPSSSASASAPASPAPASPAPATDAPTATASTGAPSATVPAATAPEAPSPGPAPAPVIAEPTPTQPAPVAAETPDRVDSQGAQSGDLDASRLVDGITAQVEDAMGPVR
ncbi:MAG: helix-turn-helix domain-containing protein [Rubrobacter sp.]